jgi:hypothetical protein
MIVTRVKEIDAAIRYPTPYYTMVSRVHAIGVVEVALTKQNVYIDKAIPRSLRGVISEM